MRILFVIAKCLVIVGSLCIARPLSAQVVPFLLPKASAKYNSADFSALDSVFRDKSVVQLGESIHMTNEMTTARAGLMKYLHQRHGLDVVFFEGSAIDSWLAADLLLNVKTVNESVLGQVRDIALPPLWRTAPFLELYRYASESLSTKTPLYFASYDLQPGMGRFRAESITRLREAISRYQPEPENVKAHGALLALLADRANGFPNKNAPDPDTLARALAEFELWVLAAAPVVDRTFPTVPHGRMLRQLPGLMRLQIELWMRHRFDPESPKFRVFQETRDRLGAGAILKLRDEVSRSGKVMVWAHHVHVFHNTLGKARHALGSDLKRWLGPKLYTIGTFASTGTIYGLHDGEEPVFVDLAKAKLPGLEEFLAGVASDNFFIDFASVADSKARSILDSETTTRREGGSMPVIPAKDFDGALLVHKVSPPELPKFK
jgi:erythromycin esterase-like protein